MGKNRSLCDLIKIGVGLILMMSLIQACDGGAMQFRLMDSTFQEFDDTIGTDGDSSKDGSGNGDGYSGLRVVGPKTVAVTGSASLVVSGGEGTISFYLDGPGELFVVSDVEATYQAPDAIHEENNVVVIVVEDEFGGRSEIRIVLEPEPVQSLDPEPTQDLDPPQDLPVDEDEIY